MLGRTTIQAFTIHKWDNAALSTARNILPLAYHMRRLPGNVLKYNLSFCLKNKSYNYPISI